MTNTKPYIIMLLVNSFAVVTMCVLFKVTTLLPTQYMDEIFHIPQAQKYCSNSFFEWDPMITTLPGLYAVSWLLLKPLSWLLHTGSACNVLLLRFTNVIFAVANLIVIMLITNSLWGKSQARKPFHLILTTLTLAIFPVLYFFSFLYYTDAGSTFWVLLCYWLTLKRCYHKAAIAGLAAILFRQTNVVWVVFCTGLIVHDKFDRFCQPQPKEKFGKHLHEFDDIFQLVKYLWPRIFQMPRMARKMLYELIMDGFGFICIGLLFVVFVWYNGSIVVGAHTDHQVCFHPVQLFYFASFTFVFLSMHILLQPDLVESLINSIKRSRLMWLLGLLVSLALVAYFTHEHSYLLADNRHYPFYVWSKIYRRHNLVRYFLVPGYLIAMWSLWIMLPHKDVLWKALFVFCTIATLTPQKLLEFRYFIIPYFIFRLNMKFASVLGVVLEFVLYVAVNAVTIYLFLYRPFTWPDKSVQRFMW